MSARPEVVERIMTYTGWYVWLATLLSVLWAIFKKGAGRT
jgi:hypothetical protein